MAQPRGYRGRGAVATTVGGKLSIESALRVHLASMYY